MNEQGTPLYHMIFATDSKAGNKIMADLYDRAASELPDMRAQARAHRRRLEAEETGVYALFPTEDLTRPLHEGEHLYRHEPSWQPREP